MDQQKIKQELQRIYQLPSEPYWYIECVKWAKIAQEYIKQGKSSEEAGFIAAKEIWKIERLVELKSLNQDISITLDKIIELLKNE
jgi:hypothetical protein